MATPSRAGPSSPPSHLAQPPPPPPASASASLPEPYDSPLKAAPSSSTVSTYAAGGQETDGPDDPADERQDGDLGLRAGPPAIRSSPVRDKGKGRAVEGPYSHVRGASGDVVLDMRIEGDEDDDEAAEERRIQQNLAKWSRADAKRRASLRRSTKLVMPSLPSPPPLSPTSLVRRTSTLLRTGSRRRGGSGAVEASSLEAGDFELGGTDAMQLEEGVAGRRARRKLSVKVGAAEGSATTLVDSSRPGGGEGGLAQVGEDDEAVRAGAPPRPPPGERLSLDDAALVTPTSTHHASNPFSPSNASFVSLESTATDRTARTASRFIEDLPVLPSSAPSTPQGSPTKRSTSTTGAGGVNPFLDVVVTSPTPTRPGALSLRTGSSHTLHTVTSNASTVNTATTTSFGAPAPPPPRTPSPAWSSNHSTPFSSPGLYTPTNARQRRPSPRTTMPSMRAASPSPSTASSAYGAQQQQRRRGGEAADDDEDEIGWLDWLLCGCFRVGDGQRDGRIEQQGRTNPME